MFAWVRFRDMRGVATEQPHGLLIGLLIVGTNMMTGCDHSARQQAGPALFSESTGVTLPDGAECLNAKTIRAALVGDTHYLKIKAPKNFSKFLAAHFEREEWEIAERLMVPPESWRKKYLSFWQDVEIAGAKLFYTKKHTSAQGSMILSVIAFNEATEIAYFVGTECRD